jgi:hypothetical protein
MPTTRKTYAMKKLFITAVLLLSTSLTAHAAGTPAAEDAWSKVTLKISPREWSIHGDSIASMRCVKAPGEGDQTMFPSKAACEAVIATIPGAGQ